VGKYVPFVEQLKQLKVIKRGFEVVGDNLKDRVPEEMTRPDRWKLRLERTKNLMPDRRAVCEK
jgi:hypothetical protein